MTSTQARSIIPLLRKKIVLYKEIISRTKLLIHKLHDEFPEIKQKKSEHNEDCRHIHNSFPQRLGTYENPV